ncbi:MAG: hypothetical protein P8168_04150 [Deltaproteobacteria bacterium]|jgi:hypothetical protein
MHCRVESYSGFRLHERPRRFTWKETWVNVDRILEQWVTPDSLCFKVRAGDFVYRLNYHQAQDAWEVELIGPG